MPLKGLPVVQAVHARFAVGPVAGEVGRGGYSRWGEVLRGVRGGGASHNAVRCRRRRARPEISAATAYARRTRRHVARNAAASYYARNARRARDAARR